MNFSGTVIAEMPKAYAIGILPSEAGNADKAGETFVIGTEKDGPIRRFAADGSPMETVVEGPGGVMTLTPTPGRTDQILATEGFFSPNFGADDARIVAYTAIGEGAWQRSVVADLPYVHRFGLLKAADGQEWLVACTIKESCREVKEDWTHPGAVWAAPVTGRFEELGEKGLPLQKVSGCQLKNHGFWISPKRDFVLITTAAGVFRYVPPATADGEWDITCLIVQPTSDACMADLDGDGVDEIVTLAPFHGADLAIWHTTSTPDVYERVWVDPQRRPFLHAIWACELAGEPCVLIGNRREGADLFRLTMSDGQGVLQPIDHGLGPANCAVVTDASGEQRVIAANRESDQVTLYSVLSD